MAAFAQVFGAIMAYTGLGDSHNHSLLLLLLKELKEGIQSTFRGIWLTQGRGTVYRNTLLVFLAGTVRAIYKLLVSSSLEPGGLQTTSLYASGVASIGLVTTIVYSLKDAGERDRLSGTSFIQMHYLVGLWLFLTGLGPAVLPGAAFFMPVSVLMPLGAAFVIGGYLNQQEKEGKLEYSSSKRRWLIVSKEDSKKQ